VPFVLPITASTITLLVDRPWRCIPGASNGIIAHVSSKKFLELLAARYSPQDIAEFCRKVVEDPEFHNSESMWELVAIALQASDRKNEGLDPQNVDSFFIDRATLELHGFNNDAVRQWIAGYHITLVPLPAAA